MRNSRPILLVEDDDTDALTTQRALKELQVPNELIRAANGEEALEYLKDKDNETPGLILLDLKIPGMSGFKFLETIKADEELRRTPVVVLTTSESNENVDESFGLGAAGYLVKPVNYKQFVESMKTLDTYLTLSRLPS